MFIQNHFRKKISLKTFHNILIFIDLDFVYDNKKKQDLRWLNRGRFPTFHERCKYWMEVSEMFGSSGTITSNQIEVLKSNSIVEQASLQINHPIRHFTAEFHFHFIFSTLFYVALKLHSLLFYSEQLSQTFCLFICPYFYFFFCLQLSLHYFFFWKNLT